MNKTFAIITDIHSNAISLTKALSIIKARNDVDQIICLGDCFALGPYPEETLKILMEIKNCIFIRGNHERYLLEKIWENDNPTIEDMDPNHYVTKEIIENEKWTADKLGKSGFKFIKAMKISHYETINKSHLEFSHAWYERDEKPPTKKEALLKRNELFKNYNDFDNISFIHGHTHIPKVIKIENINIFCQGATGLPFDKKVLGSVAFLTTGEVIKWEVQRYKYDYKKVLYELEKREIPFYKNLIRTIKYASIRN